MERSGTMTAEFKQDRAIYLAGVVTTEAILCARTPIGDYDMPISLKWEEGIIGAIAVFANKEDAIAYTKENGGSTITQQFVSGLTVKKEESE